LTEPAKECKEKTLIIERESNNVRESWVVFWDILYSFQIVESIGALAISVLSEIK
jgi:hypothetical protein